MDHDIFFFLFYLSLFFAEPSFVVNHFTFGQLKTFFFLFFLIFFLLTPIPFSLLISKHATVRNPFYKQKTEKYIHIYLNL